MVIHRNLTHKLKQTKLFLPFVSITLITTLSTLALLSTATSADTRSISTSVKVLEACSMTTDTSASTAHYAEIVGGTANQNIGLTAIDVTCNDRNGYSVYVQGVDSLAATSPSTNLVGATTGQTIPTGTDMSSNVSNWAIRLASVNDDTTYFVPTIVNGFDSNHVIPSTPTKAVTFTSSIDTSKPSRFTTTYAAAVTPYQSADTYTGYVKYTLVHPDYANSEGKIYMQDLTPTTIANLLPSVNSTVDVYDKRDEQQYTIAKLADGKYWMTTNLNLAGETPLYSDTSNVPSGYPSAGGTAYYTLPTTETLEANSTRLQNTNAFSDDSTAYVFNSNSTDCSSTSPCYSYYSYLAATAGSGTDIINDGYNAQYSICPKGWRLPTSTTSNASATGNNNWQTGDFWKMATQYGLSTSSYYERPDNSPTFYSQAGPGTTPNFLPAGYYSGGSFHNGGSDGEYQSATSYSSTGAYRLYFNSSLVYSAGIGPRSFGLPVRCLFAE